MLRHFGSNLLVIPVLLAICAIGPVVAQTSESSHRDNSGRQLAVVVPGIPDPPPLIPVVTVPVPVGVPTPKMEASAVAGHLRTAAIVAKDISDTYVKRARDLATFAAMVWDSVSGLPLLSPLSSPPAPAPMPRLPRLSSTPEP